MHTINSLNVKESRVKKVTKIEPFFTFKKSTFPTLIFLYSNQKSLKMTRSSQTKD